jgi:uncharacterized protein (DUF885 family)
MKITLLLLLLLLPLLSFNFKPSDPNSDFEKMAEQFLNEYLTWRPETGTYLGLHEYDGKVSDYSESSINEEIARLNNYKNLLKTIDASQLNPQNYIDYKMLQNEIDKSLFGLSERRGWKRNPMTYASVDVNIYISRDFAPLEDRVRSIINILKSVPQQFADARANLDEVVPVPYVKTAILIAKGSADFLGKDLLVALQEVKNEELMNEFTVVNNQAIKELNDYAVWLETEKLPKADNNFPLGRELYQKMLTQNEMVNYTPEQILEIGMQQLKKEQKEFEETAKIIDPTKSAVEVYKDIQKDHPTAEGLIPDTRKNLEAIRQYLVDKDIVTIPSEVRVLVKETPQYARATSFASMDTPGPFEKSTQAYYYVTPIENDWSEAQKEEWLTAFNYYTTDIVSIHEAYPGHYIQFLHTNASPISKLQKIFGSYAYSEGWAHYTEKMMIDEGFGSDKDSIIFAKYKLAQLAESLLRYCRLCASIMMHTQGMSVEDATKFFMENCYYEEQPAKSEANRGTYDPGYLNYSLGKLMIYKLREDYIKQEGANYSLKKFHDIFLDNGMPPIPMMREIMLTDKSKWNEIL